MMGGPSPDSTFKIGQKVTVVNLDAWLKELFDREIAPLKLQVEELLTKDFNNRAIIKNLEKEVKELKSSISNQCNNFNQSQGSSNLGAPNRTYASLFQSKSDLLNAVSKENHEREKKENSVIISGAKLSFDDFKDLHGENRSKEIINQAQPILNLIDSNLNSNSIKKSKCHYEKE